MSTRDTLYAAANMLTDKNLSEHYYDVMKQAVTEGKQGVYSLFIGVGENKGFFTQFTEKGQSLKMVSDAVELLQIEVTTPVCFVYTTLNDNYYRGLKRYLSPDEIKTCDAIVKEFSVCGKAFAGKTLCGLVEKLVATFPDAHKKYQIAAIDRHKKSATHYIYVNIGSEQNRLMKAVQCYKSFVPLSFITDCSGRLYKVDSI